MNDTHDKSLHEKKLSLKTEPLYARILGQRYAHILIIGVALLSLIFMRKLHELKIISWFFIGAILLLIALLATELKLGGAQPGTDGESMLHAKVDYHLITAFNIVLQAFSAQFMVMPAFSEMKRKSNARFGISSFISISLVALIFIAVAILGVYLFGESLTEDILTNMAQRKGSLSAILRSVFSVVLLLNVQFMFFAAKEQSLVLHDEIQNRSISK